MKFAFLGYHREETWDAMSKSAQEAMIDDCFTFDSKLLKAGYLIDLGAALQASRTAKTLRWRQGAVVVTDGPFAETKEVLGGVGMLEAHDMAHAVELLSKHPGLRYGSTFEIRPINEEALERQATTIAALRGSTPAVAPDALRFASFGYFNENGWDSVPQEERDAMMARCSAFDEGRIKSGEWLSGIALQSARTAKTLRCKGSQVVVTDGPFAETKEVLGGVVVLAHNDLTDAVATLSTHPALAFGVVMELRPINEEINDMFNAYRERVKSLE
jgi:hypothetical protein